MIVIYTPEVTNRVHYIFSFVFEYLLGKEIIFNPHKSPETQELSITYGISGKDTDVFFPSFGLLQEEKIQPQKIEVEKHAELNLPVFFKTQHPNQILPFDVFSAAFYLLTRYEEYLPHRKDIHGRYISEQSLAFQNQFLERPLVNEYADLIRQKIKKIKPEVTFMMKHSFTHLPTFDIDTTYAFKGRGLKNPALIVRDILRRDFKTLVQRIQVLYGKRKDPFDTYGLLLELIKETKRDAIFFFLVENNGENSNPTAMNYIEKNIREIAKQDNLKTGIHPSYHSESYEKVAEEKKNLEEIIQKSVYQSRFHFLKWYLPDSYSNLIKAGIKEDFSMAYPDKPGFRASVCHPFKWFNLSENKVTDLTIYPFSLMDATYKYYKNEPFSAICETALTLRKEVEKHEGFFITNFHNDSFCDEELKYRNWVELFRKLHNG